MVTYPASELFSAGYIKLSFGLIFRLILLSYTKKNILRNSSICNPVRDLIWVGNKISVSVPSRTGRNIIRTINSYPYLVPNGAFQSFNI